MRERLKQLDTWDAPEQWREIESRRPHDPDEEPSPHRSRLAAGLVAASVAIAGVGLGLAALSRLDSTPDPTPDGTAGTQRIEVNASTIDTGLRLPEGVVVSDGSVWVATRHALEQSGDVVRFDPATGQEQARISMPSLPGWEFGGAGITSGLGSVWVAAGGTDGHPGSVVYRLDPATNSLVETIDIGQGHPADLWVDETGIWALSFPTDGSELTLYRADPTTHEVTDHMAIPASWSQNVFAASGWIYVLGNTDNSNGAPAETLFRIDPAAMTIVDRSQPAGGQSLLMTPSADRLWFFDHGLRALDAATGAQVVGPIDLPEACCAGVAADGEGGAWVVNGQGDAPRTGVWHVDRNGSIVAASEGDLGNEADGLAIDYDAATSSLWIVHYQDTVLRLGIRYVDEPSASPGRRLGIYEAMIRHLAGQKQDPIYVSTELCSMLGEPVGEPCSDRLSRIEQLQLASRLADLGGGGVFSDKGGSEELPRILLGPIIEKESGGLRVEGGSVCGGLCGSGAMYIVTETENGYEILGTDDSYGSWIA